MSPIQFKKSGPIATLTLNQPENLNAMTGAMGDAMKELVPQINDDPEIRIVILTGAGRAFSAGGDLDFILDRTTKDPATNKKDMIAFYSKFLSLRDIQVPTIAMINGHAIGAGFLIALGCDLRYASRDAKMAANFAKIGLSSGMGGLYWLTKLAGPARTADLLFTGRTIQAEEAKDLGLINDYFAPEDLEKRTKTIAEQIAANAPGALKIIKKGIQKAVTADLEEVFDYESSGQAQSFSTKDLIEGVNAIREKRKPNFSGN